MPFYLSQFSSFVATVNTAPIRDRMMNLKMKELVNELNAANLEQESVLTTIAEIRSSLFDLVSW